MVSKLASLIDRPVRFQVGLIGTYRHTWGAWESIREVVQNALDARDDLGHEMTIGRIDDIIHVDSAGADLDRRVWLMGATGKKAGESRGQFGEGLKLAALAALRSGKTFTVHTQTETHLTSLEPFGWVEGADLVLTVQVIKRKGKRREGVGVEITGITDEDWNIAKSRLLDLTPPERVTATDEGNILSGEALRGQVFVRGIYVATEDLAYGYDIKVEVDCDRKMVAHDAARIAMAKAWNAAAVKNLKLVESHIVPMLETSTNDVEKIATYAHHNVINAAVVHFRKKYGDTAIPVRTSAEALEAGHYARSGVVLPTAYVELLERQMLTLSQYRNKYRQSVETTYKLKDLDAEEIMTWEETLALVEVAAARLGLAGIEDRASIVKFKGEGLNGLHLGDNTIYISRHLLTAPKELRRVLVHEVSHDVGCDAAKAHEVMEGRMHTEIQEYLIETLTALQGVDKDTPAT